MNDSCNEFATRVTYHVMESYSSRAETVIKFRHPRTCKLVKLAYKYVSENSAHAVQNARNFDGIVYVTNKSHPSIGKGKIDLRNRRGKHMKLTLHRRRMGT